MFDSITIIPVLTSIISTIIAFWALIVSRKSANETKRQADKAEEANQYARMLGQSEAVIHFTSRFFDLMKGKPDFRDEEWVYQLWSLHATEFYFFHHDLLPDFMYRLWMIELGSMYVDYPDSWPSHEKYLNNYSSNYPIMCDFFRGIHKIALEHRNDLASRNRKIEDFVHDWCERHR